MARITYEKIVDSYTGKEIKEADVVETILVLDNEGYELDLTADSKSKLLAALEPFIKSEDAIRTSDPLNKRSDRPARGRPRGTATPTTPAIDRPAIQKFAELNDLPAVGDRGRMPNASVEAYLAAGSPSLAELEKSA